MHGQVISTPYRAVALPSCACDVHNVLVDVVCHGLLPELDVVQWYADAPEMDDVRLRAHLSSLRVIQGPYEMPGTYGEAYGHHNEGGRDRAHENAAAGAHDRLAAHDDKHDIEI